MSKTGLADVIVPSVFEKYVIERTAALAAFFRSGIVVADPIFDGLAAGGGRTVDLPFWQDISPTRQLLSDTASLTVNKITATRDTARIHNDAQVWSVNHLAAALSAGDPMGAIIQLVAQYWARTDEALVISCLKGMFSAASMASNLLAIHSESIGGQSTSTRLNGITFVDALALLGDAAKRLTAVAMHSATEAALKKADLIQFIPASAGEPALTQFQGRTVIVDDSLPVRAGSTDGQVYTTYLFGMASFIRGNAKLDQAPVEGGFGTQGVEIARVPLDSDTVLINRRRYIMHPMGVRFTSSSVAGDSPTAAELETGANWERVREAKNVRIVAVTHNN